ncbi:MAG TPA: tetratricopeptide repeat protein [Thermoanaerobaculia bacterium]
MSNVIASAEELRQQALLCVRRNELDRALALYDEALAIAENDELRELLTINKADVLIALEQTTGEVQKLPAIVMRRRNPHHTFLAAYALTYKHRLQNDVKRGIFYAQIALDTAVEASEPLWELGAHNELGSLYEIDGDFAKAITAFNQALQLVGHVADEQEQSLSRGAALQNLGASKMLNGEVPEGVALIHDALPLIVSPSSRAEAYIDLCYGYIELDRLEEARSWGEQGLELASENRQIRNAHYLLAEAAYKSGHLEVAEFHYDKLATFYPNFRHLKHLLMAVDLRSMVNLKA